MRVVKIVGTNIVIPRFSAEGIPRRRKSPGRGITRDQRADAVQVLNRVFRRERLERPDGGAVVSRPVSASFHDMVRALAVGRGKKRVLEALQLV